MPERETGELPQFGPTCAPNCRRGAHDKRCGRESHVEFVEALTTKLSSLGVPAMPSWPEAIDYLAEHGGSLCSCETAAVCLGSGEPAFRCRIKRGDGYCVDRARASGEKHDTDCRRDDPSYPCPGCGLDYHYVNGHCVRCDALAPWRT